MKAIECKIHRYVTLEKIVNHNHEDDVIIKRSNVINSKGTDNFNRYSEVTKYGMRV